MQFMSDRLGSFSAHLLAAACLSLPWRYYAAFGSERTSRDNGFFRYHCMGCADITQ